MPRAAAFTLAGYAFRMSSRGTRGKTKTPPHARPGDVLLSRDRASCHETFGQLSCECHSPLPLCLPRCAYANVEARCPYHVCLRRPDSSVCCGAGPEGCSTRGHQCHSPRHSTAHPPWHHQNNSQDYSNASQCHRPGTARKAPHNCLQHYGVGQLLCTGQGPITVPTASPCRHAHHPHLRG